MEERNRPIAGEQLVRAPEKFIFEKQQNDADMYDKYCRHEFLSEQALKPFIDKQDYFIRADIRESNEARAPYGMEPKPEYSNEQLHLISMGRIGVVGVKLGFSSEERRNLRAWGAQRPYGARYADENFMTQLEWIDITSKQESKEKPDKPYTYEEIEEQPHLQYVNKLWETHPENLKRKKEGDVTIEKFHAGIAEELATRQERPLTERESQLRAMGEIGERLEELQVGWEERSRILERLAKYPETITKAADALRSVPEETKKLKRDKATEIVRHATGYIEEKAQVEAHKKTVETKLADVRELLRKEFGEDRLQNGSRWIVASREEVNKRLVGQKLAPMTDAEWERIIIEDAENEMIGRGDRDKTDPIYELELADRKAKYLTLNSLTPAEQEAQHQKNLQEMNRMKKIKELASLTNEEWEAMKKRKELPAGLGTAREWTKTKQDDERTFYKQWFEGLPPELQFGILKSAYEQMQPENEKEHPIRDAIKEILKSLLNIFTAYSEGMQALIIQDIEEQEQKNKLKNK